MVLNLDHLDFEIVSDFDIRISHFAGIGPSTSVEDSLQIRLFLQNKPKVKYAQINVSPFMISKYYIMDIWLSGKNKPKTNPKQSQTNPNSEMPKMSLNTYPTRVYSNKSALRLKQNKPKTNPK